MGKKEAETLVIPEYVLPSEEIMKIAAEEGIDLPSGALGSLHMSPDPPTRAFVVSMIRAYVGIPDDDGAVKRRTNG